MTTPPPPQSDDDDASSGESEAETAPATGTLTVSVDHNWIDATQGDPATVYLGTDGDLDHADTAAPADGDSGTANVISREFQAGDQVLLYQGQLVAAPGKFYYDPEVSCSVDGAAIDVAGDGTAVTPWTFTMPEGDVTCTITNTDPANAAYRYWMDNSTPASGSNVSPGQPISYTLHADTTNSTSNGAAVIATLASTGGLSLPSGVTIATGSATRGTLSVAGSVITWNIGNGLGTTDETATFTVTPGADAPVNSKLTVTVAGDSSNNGTFRNGGSRISSTTHTVVACAASASTACITVSKQTLRSDVNFGVVGAKFAAVKYTSATQNPANGADVATCTIQTGQTSCVIKVTGFSNNDRYWIVERTAPTGTSALDIATGSATQLQVDSHYPGITPALSNSATTNTVSMPAQAYQPPATGNTLAAATSIGNVVNVLDNVTPNKQCNEPLNVALVLDMSASIYQKGFGNNPDIDFRSQYQTGVDTLLSKLAGANVQVAAFTFSSGASKLASLQSASSIKSTIDSTISGTGYDAATNWDAGLRAVSSDSDSYDVVIMVTDGAPNRYTGNTSASSVLFASVESAVLSANEIKHAGMQMIAVGVGAISDTATLGMINLSAISSSDKAFIGGWDSLGTQLAGIANTLTCQGTVTVNKTTVNGTTTTANVAGWNFTAQASGEQTGSTKTTTNASWTYQFSSQSEKTDVTITEGAAPSGSGGSWTLTGVVCGSSAVTLNSDGKSWTVKDVTVGTNLTCTATNTFNPYVGTLKLKKIVSGDGYTQSNQNGDFTVTVSGCVTPSVQVTLKAADDWKNLTVPAGNCTVTESNPAAGLLAPGYTWAAQTYGTGQNPSTFSSTAPSVTVTNGGTQYVTVKNTTVDNRPTVNLYKKWVNGISGDSATLKINGANAANATVAGAGTDGVSTGFATTKVTPGSSVSISESMSNSGVYTASDLQCALVGDDSPAVQLTGWQTGGTSATFTAPQSGTVNCQFTNTRNTVLVNLVKSWADSPANDDAVTLTVSGSESGPGANGSNSNDGNANNDSAATLTAKVGETVTIGESFTAGAPANYTTTYACVYGTGNTAVTVTANNTFVVTSAMVGSTVTCTVTNTAKDVQLTLVKHVVNDDGGTTPASHWTLQAKNGDVKTVSGPGQEGGTVYSVPAGTYTLSESGDQTGYTASSWSCTPTAASGSTITLTLGTNVTCTITNDDIAPKLTLVKTVDNGDTGGTAVPGNWTLAAAGSSKGFSGAGNSAAVTNETVTAGVVYTLSESGGPAGYTAGSWQCTGAATWSSTNGTVTPALGENVTCTIVNTAQQATLKLVKVVVNNNGGTKQKTDWTLTATKSGAQTAAVNVQDTATNVGPGTYTLAESGDQTGYSPSLWTCDSNKTVTDSQVTVALGEHITCTITNDDIAPKLTLKKYVSNGDNSGYSADWTLTAAAGGTDLINGKPSTAGNGISASATANVVYTLSESDGPTGYDNGTAWQCTSTEGTFTKTDNTVKLNPGADVTCTITNTPKPTHTLTVIKSWVNAHVGDSVGITIGSDASVTVTASDATTSDKTVTKSVMRDDTFTLSEVPTAGNTGTYTDSGFTCTDANNGAVTPNDGVYTMPDANVTCTITNTRTSVTVNLTKVWVNGADRDTTGLTVTGASSGSGTATSTADGTASFTDSAHKATATVRSGDTVTLSEALGEDNAGAYTVIGFTCGDSPAVTWTDKALSATFTAPASGTVNCTVTNTRTFVQLTLQKAWVNGVKDDTTVLTINGAAADTAGNKTSTADGTAGTQTDTANAATATVYSGVTVNLGETLGADNKGTYTPTLECADVSVTGGDSIGDGGAVSGSVTIPKDQTQPITCTYTNTGPSVTIEKSVTKDSADWNNKTVAIGDTLTWTITVKNTGTVAYTGKLFEDDLTSTLTGIGETASDLTVTPSDDSVTASFSDSSNLLVGTATALPGGATVTVSYTGTVVAQAAGAEGIDNVVTPMGDVPTCADENACETDNPFTTSVTVEKGVYLLEPGEDPEPWNGMDAKAGDTLVWTITVHNTGTVAVTGELLSDDLTSVIAATGFDPAASGAFTVSPDGGVVVTPSDTSFTVNAPDGGLASGATVTISYSGTVVAQSVGATGVTNVAAPNGENDVTCVAAAGQGQDGESAAHEPCETSNDFPTSVAVSKSVTSKQDNGDGTWSLTYTIRVTNGSTVATAYDLNDTFAFGSGITVTGTPSVSGVDDSDPAASITGLTAGWDGAGQPEIIAGRLLAVGHADTYTVTVTAVVPSGSWTEGDGPAAAQCNPPDGENEPGTPGGFGNNAFVWLGQPAQTDDGESDGDETDGDEETQPGPAFRNWQGALVLATTAPRQDWLDVAYACDTPTPPVTELTIVKTASVSTVSAGSSFTYGITVKNDSKGRASDVHLSDPIPATIKITGITTDDTATPGWGSSCAVTGADANGFGGTLNCDLNAELAAGASAPVVTLAAEVSGAASPGSIPNTATVTWQNPDDPEGGGEASDTATVTIPSPPTNPPTEPPTSTPPTSTPPTTTEVSPSVSVLPTSQTEAAAGTSNAPTTSIEVQGETGEVAYTGVNVLGMGLIALLLLSGGVLLLALGGRRRSPKTH